MDSLRRNAGVPRLEHISNKVIRGEMEAEQNIKFRIEIRNILWFGPLMRIPEEHWPKVMFNWQPPNRRKGEDFLEVGKRTRGK